MQKNPLDTNYRCGRYIVEASLNLISHNRERFDKKIIAASKSKAPVTFADFENRRDENIFLIRDIDKKIKAGAIFSDFAVLFRTNTQPRQLIEQLMGYNIPFKPRIIYLIYMSTGLQETCLHTKELQEAAETELIFADYEQTKAVSVKRQSV